MIQTVHGTTNDFDSYKDGRSDFLAGYEKNYPVTQIILLPIQCTSFQSSACEQHVPHLPLTVDTIDCLK